MKPILVLFFIALGGCASVTKKETAETVASPTPVAAPVAPDGLYYVQPGDTGAKIAEAHHVALADLVAWNPNLDVSRLRVGQEIRVKAK